jgi:hypothetical protein
MTTTAEIADFIATDFPQNNCIIETTGNKGATVRPVAHAVGTYAIPTSQS